MNERLELFDARATRAEVRQVQKLLQKQGWKEQTYNC